ncbi:adenosylcobinamide-phosphate synthase CbiB [Acetobacter fabarum]|uniref:adenosylcobinamide-phosphate synthase CbiB n=1 Tax=Acetobacter fabarum TaxID=483199 RepID=UPI00312BB0E8
MPFFPLSTTLPVAALAAGMEAAWGYPPPLLNMIGHPVMWIGALIDRLEHVLNRRNTSERTRRLLGFVALALIITIPVALTVGLLEVGYTLLPAPVMLLVQAGLTSTLVAQRSLWAHVHAVGTALRHNGLTAGRKAVGMIVGRDTTTLDEAGVVRAALESLAENFSDGIVAPLFWTALFGLPGAVFYKCVNTADSMIGHLNPRYRAFGMAAAKLDDLINLPASRLAALCLMLAAPRRQWPHIWRTIKRDAPHHRSPNAGWPEAAMAAALNTLLAGPRSYGGKIVKDPWIGSGSSGAGIADLERGLRLYRRACGLLIAGLLCAALSGMIGA